MMIIKLKNQTIINLSGFLIAIMDYRLKTELMVFLSKKRIGLFKSDKIPHNCIILDLKISRMEELSIAV